MYSGGIKWVDGKYRNKGSYKCDIGFNLTKFSFNTWEGVCW